MWKIKSARKKQAHNIKINEMYLAIICSLPFIKSLSIQRPLSIWAALIDGFWGNSCHFKQERFFEPLNITFSLLYDEIFKPESFSLSSIGSQNSYSPSNATISLIFFARQISTAFLRYLKEAQMCPDFYRLREEI